MNTHTNDTRRIRTVTAVSTIAAGILIILVEALDISAVGVDVDLLAQPADLITVGAAKTDIFRWSWLLAVFGYYLLLIPIMLHLRSWLDKVSHNLAHLYTTAGIAYAIVGAIALAIMATTLPPMMRAWPDAAGAQKQSLESVFKVVTNATFSGLGSLTFVLGGFWWLGIGSLIRTEKPVIGLVTIFLGVGTLVSGLGYLLGVDLLSRLELVNYLLAPVWALWIGVVVTRDRTIDGCNR